MLKVNLPLKMISSFAPVIYQVAAQDIRGQPGTSGGGSTGHPGWQWICFGFFDKPRYSDEEDDAARWEQQIPL